MKTEDWSDVAFQTDEDFRPGVPYLANNRVILLEFCYDVFEVSECI
jgi:hypothetical protein